MRNKSQEQKRPHLPIGYWLKKADELLTARINEAQEANGLTRTEWQILNVLHEAAPVAKSQIVETLSPFGDPASLGSAVDALVDRGLVEDDGSGSGKLQLSPQGRGLHAAALEMQKKRCDFSRCRALPRPITRLRSGSCSRSCRTFPRLGKPLKVRELTCGLFYS